VQGAGDVYHIDEKSIENSSGGCIMKILYKSFAKVSYIRASSGVQGAGDVYRIDENQRGKVNF
jgi:hypothetical protein